MPTAIQAASGKAEEEPILGLYRRRIRGPRGNVERLGCCTPDADRRGRGAFSWDGGQRRRSSSGRRGRRRRSKRQALGLSGAYLALITPVASRPTSSRPTASRYPTKITML